MTSKPADPVQALAEAVHQKQTITESLTDLRAQAQHAATNYHDADDQREHYEGDALVGAVSADTLAKCRARRDAARQDHRRASPE